MECLVMVTFNNFLNRLKAILAGTWPFRDTVALNYRKFVRNLWQLGRTHVALAWVKWMYGIENRNKIQIAFDLWAIATNREHILHDRRHRATRPQSSFECKPAHWTHRPALVEWLCSPMRRQWLRFVCPRQMWNPYRMPRLDDASFVLRWGLEFRFGVMRICAKAKLICWHSETNLHSIEILLDDTFGWIRSYVVAILVPANASLYFRNDFFR